MTTADMTKQNSTPTVPYLVLLSGTLGDETLWKDVVEPLGSTVETVCLRTDTGSTVREIAHATLAAAPAVFSLAGHSFGGIVALEMQRLTPTRIARIALLNASARAGSEAQQKNWSDTRNRIMAGEFVAVAQELAHATLPEYHRQTRLIERNMSMATAVGAAGFLRQLQAQASRPSSLSTLADITVPAMIVIGADDEMCPPERQHEVARLVPNSTTRVISGAGHMVPLEVPHEAAELLRTWMTTSATENRDV